MSVSAQNLDWNLEHAKSNLKTSLSQIWMICHLLPFVRVGQYWTQGSEFLFHCVKWQVTLSVFNPVIELITKYQFMHFNQLLHNDMWLRHLFWKTNWIAIENINFAPRINMFHKTQQQFWNHSNQLSKPFANQWYIKVYVSLLLTTPCLCNLHRNLLCVFPTLPSATPPPPGIFLPSCHKKNIHFFLLFTNHISWHSCLVYFWPYSNLQLHCLVIYPSSCRWNIHILMLYLFIVYSINLLKLFVHCTLYKSVYV